MPTNENLPMLVEAQDLGLVVVISVFIAFFAYELITSVITKAADYLRKRNQPIKPRPIFESTPELNRVLLTGLFIALAHQFKQPISEVRAMDRNTNDLPDRKELFKRLQAQHESLGITLMPIMDRKTFARTVGITDGTLTKLISREYIPAVKFDNGIKNSRFSPVNVAALWTACLEQAKDWQARQGD